MEYTTTAESSVDHSEFDSFKGSNFFLSVVLALKNQRKQLMEENVRLRAQIAQLKHQNAAFIDLGADRLLQMKG